MEINLKRITNLSDLHKIRDLYISAFPPKERREFYELAERIHLNEFTVYLVLISGGKTSGFCMIWDFSDFVYLEHFAIKPELRGHGIGEGVLSIIRKKYPVILLETEPPVDEISIRRVNFYKRNGFKLMQLQYIQPSYGKDKPHVELNIMSTDFDISEETLDQYILQIKGKVYQKIV